MREYFIVSIYTIAFGYLEYGIIIIIMLSSEEVTPLVIVDSDSILFKPKPSPTNILTLTNWKIKLLYFVSLL
jgi:hypothetical protein